MWRVFKQHELLRVCSIKETELTALIRFPHGLLHLLEAQKLICRVKQVVIRHIPSVRHLERADIRRPCLHMQLLQVKVVQTPISGWWIVDADASFPVVRPEKTVEISDLLRMTDESIDFLVHEIDELRWTPNVRQSEQVGNFNGFFGTDDWKRCVGVNDPPTRNRCLHDLYLQQLHMEAGAAYVRSFEMSNARGVTDYYLFYATNELLGLKKMKEAMWKADESGEFRFSDATDPDQFILFEKAPSLPALRARIVNEFSGKDVTVGNIEKFAIV